MSEVEVREATSFETPVERVERESPEYQGAPGSLHARMERHQQQRAARTTEIFDVPGFVGVLAVELRRLTGRTSVGIELRHEKVAELFERGVRAAADKVLNATVALYEVNGAAKTVLEGESWLSLARSFLGDKLAQDATQRQAIIALLGEDEIVSLCNAWSEWEAAETPDDGAELKRDFPGIR